VTINGNAVVTTLFSSELSRAATASVAMISQNRLLLSNRLAGTGISLSNDSFASFSWPCAIVASMARGCSPV